MFVIVGLGNPGREYAKTRHNVGFMTIDKIAERLNISVNKKGFRSVYGEGRLGGTRVVLAKPETFMNNSGWAVGDLLKWYKPQHDELVVIYDDIDLPCGALRIRMNGSAGTHNGMRSIESLIGFEDFPRIRVGIGKPAHGLIDHVLGVPNDEEAKLIDGAMMQAAEAAELIIAGKPEEAQTRFNYKPPKNKRRNAVCSPQNSVMFRRGSFPHFQSVRKCSLKTRTWTRMPLMRRSILSVLNRLRMQKRGLCVLRRSLRKHSPKRRRGTV